MRALGAAVGTYVVAFIVLLIVSSVRHPNTATGIGALWEPALSPFVLGAALLATILVLTRRTGPRD